MKILLAVAAAVATVAVPQLPAIAQSSAQSNSDDLQDALRRIAINSNDSSALADAGLAALELGDMRAAIGFLAKADQIYSTSGRVKAGLGRALLAEENPFGAIRYFDQAVANGIAVSEIAADRGLAYDLIGRNRDAQKDYELAMRNGADNQLIARYAVSLGISGDVERADAQLNPLLQKSDRDAWRNRAFIYAMNGKKKDAENIVEQTMERRMAKAIKPFLDRMPKLTAAQKAAAVHFGHFPASENIGVDVAAVQLASSQAAENGSGVDAGLIPVGEALGTDSKRPRVLAMPDKSPRRRPGTTERKPSERELRRAAKKKEAESSARMAATTPLPASTASSPTLTRSQPDPAPLLATSQVKEPDAVVAATMPPERNGTSPGFATTLGVSQPPVLVSQTVERKVEIAGRQPESAAAVAQPVQSPAAEPDRTGGPVNLISFDLAKQSATPTGMAAAEPASRPLADIISGIRIPEREIRSEVVPVDLDEIEPAKPQPKVVAKAVDKTPAKPKEPEHPKRYWVQIATGSNLDALKFDYRRMTKKQPDVFKGQKAWTSPWGRTRRLVVGPFADFKAAKAFEADYRKDGGDGFAWASADGVEVNELGK
ncbi:SPOR domain-containing protein [Sphingorhabdus sp. YGSMI21]|uniref:SPOR domain-containing protein n=1 Tax=Sphingorhabdus sp. YGSMI21 TaxID=2077182 RepID=UPI0013D9DAF3|nr:SPOR domain-containing protein [Sphingorhabdus sp. YGSMI21]